jgi:hypothetical protein
MRCKPPGCRQPSLASRPACRALTPARRTGAYPEPGRAAAVGSCVTVGQLRRNAVAVHGVKLGAAPDAPPWGEVLACLPPVPVRIQRRAVAARDIHLPPHHHTCQARSVHGGGKPVFPVSVLVPALGLASRGVCCEWKAARKTAGRRGTWRGTANCTTSSGPANRPEHDSGRQRPSLHDNPRPGKDPS